MANEATVQPRETETTPVPVERVSRSRVADQDLTQLGFGRVFADHMFPAEYEQVPPCRLPMSRRSLTVRTS